MRAKPHVHLVHWRDTELDERRERLQRAGFSVAASSEEGGGAARAIAGRVPQVVVIDLERLPSHGCHLAAWLGQQKKTRAAGIVFVGGSAQAIARARKQFSTAEFVTWRGIKGGVQRALARPAAAPVPATAGYSGTPLPTKLGIKAAATVALLGAPPGFEAQLQPLPDGVAIRRRAQGECDVLLLFADRLATLERRLPAACNALRRGGGLWIAWPKKASGVPTDVTESAVRARGLATGLVDNKICAVDAVWSGLRFVHRTKSAGKSKSPSTQRRSP